MFYKVADQNVYNIGIIKNCIWNFECSRKISIKRYKCYSGPDRMTWSKYMVYKPSYHVYIDQLNNSCCLLSAWSLRPGRLSKVKSLNFVIWWHNSQSKWPLWKENNVQYLSHHIFCSFYNPFITTLRVVAELDIPFSTARTLTMPNPTQFLGFGKTFQPFLSL